MEQRLANLEARDQLLHAPTAPVIAAPTKCPRERIKQSEVPKFVGKYHQ